MPPTPIRVQQAGCGARYSLQRCRNQGAVHRVGVQGEGIMVLRHWIGRHWLPCLL